jgi:hypothetical protein
VAPPAPRSPWVAAAYTPAGRLWVLWFDVGELAYQAVLGNAKGAGGDAVSIGSPRPGAAGGFATEAIATPAGLAVVTNWISATGIYSRYLNVVAPG